MSGVRWLDRNAVLAVHEELLAEHGGGAGVRDAALLDSALARPQNIAGYGDPDIAALAAAYAFGVARNHPFVDGNKRTALVTAELFLAINGYALTASDESCVLTIISLAEGKLTEAALARWIAAHLAET